MSAATVWSLLLGLGLGVGLWLIVAARPVGWRPSLVQRVEPQLRHHVPGSRLLAQTEELSSPWGAWARLLLPPLRALTDQVQRFSPAGETLSRRLEAAGGGASVADHRAQQVLAVCLGAGVGAVAGTLLAVADRIPVVTAVALVVAAGMGGHVLCDQLLSARIARRRRAVLSEFPSVAELFALSVGAGESAAGAMERIARTARGELAGEFARALSEVRAGSSLSAALKGIGRRLQVAPVDRFVSGVLIALDRGTPLADVLRAQAQDVRELGRRELLEAAGRKEIQMMVPLVFGILPLTVVFAVFPGIALLRIGL